MKTSKWNQFSQFNKTYAKLIEKRFRKDLDWLHFDNEPRVLREGISVGKTILHTHFCSLYNIPVDIGRKLNVNKIRHSEEVLDIF